jgi:recombination protein RecT
MAVKNNLAQRTKRQTFSAYLTQDAVKTRINQMVGSKDGQRFITALISAVSANPDLATCDYGTILSAAMLGESLKLSPSPQLGHYYMVPFDDNRNNRRVATFVLGYKGYIQLALRSGYYKKLNVIAIKEGELKRFDPLNEEIECELIEDFATREKAKTVGYYAMFEYLNGFRKAIYWSREQMEAHALQYSPGYRSDVQKGRKYTFWSKDFDGMAYKTMLRQLISKWGIMSIELQTAFERDDSLLNEDGSFEYVDNTDSAPDDSYIDTTATQVDEAPEESDATDADNPDNDAIQDSFFDNEAGA